MQDAKWIVQLGRFGLSSSSYISSHKAVQLRLFTRRLRFYNQQAQVKNEVHNRLQELILS